MAQAITKIVFDIGGVLIDWSPDYLYAKLIPDAAERQKFLSEVCTPEWNYRQDQGRPYAEAEAELIARYPDKRALIEAWRMRFNETMKSEIAGSVDVLAALRDSKIPLYALSNWPTETFPVARARFDFLSWFDGIVVSGEEKVAKPDARLFDILMRRYSIDPRTALFIDDRAENIEAAAVLGFTTHLFTTADKLADDLRRLNLLPLQRCA